MAFCDPCRHLYPLVLTGALVFEPATLTISKGESVTFVNNAGFPHNVVFDEDEVPVSAADVTAVAQCPTGMGKSFINIGPRQVGVGTQSWKEK